MGALAEGADVPSSLAATRGPQSLPRRSSPPRSSSNARRTAVTDQRTDREHQEIASQSTRRSFPGGPSLSFSLPSANSLPRELSMEPLNLDRGRRQGVGFGGQSPARGVVARDLTCSSIWGDDPYNAASRVCSTWENGTPPLTHERTGSPSTGTRGGVFANWPVNRRGTTMRCMCPKTVSRRILSPILKKTRMHAPSPREEGVDATSRWRVTQSPRVEWAVAGLRSRRGGDGETRFVDESWRMRGRRR
jgi:hypothetical protein